MYRKIRNYQLISMIYFVFLFSPHLSAYGEHLLVPSYSDPNDQGLALLIFNNSYAQQIDKNPIPTNITI